MPTFPEWTRKDIKFEVLDRYTKQELVQYFILPMLPLLRNNLLQLRKLVPNEYKDSLSLVPTLKTNARKEILLDVASLLFCNLACFKLYWESFSPKAKTVLEYLAFNGDAPYWLLEKRLGLVTYEQIIKRERQWGDRFIERKIMKPLPELDNIPHIVPRHYAYGYNHPLTLLTFTLRPELAYLLVGYISQLQDFQVRPQVNMPLAKTAEARHLNVEQAVLRNIPPLVIYLRDKNPKVNAKGRPYAAAIKAFYKNMEIEEFYPDTIYKDLSFLRSNLMLSLLLQAPNLPINDAPPTVLKYLFQTVYPIHFRTALHTLTHVKKMTGLKIYDFTPQETALREDLRKLAQQTKDWIVMQEWERNLQLLPEYLEFVEKYALTKCYIEIPGRLIDSQYSVDVSVMPHLKDDLIIHPALRATVFLFAAWGLVEIVYLPIDYEAVGYTCASPYDGIQAFRFTDLGRFVLGVDETYQGKVERAFELALAEDSLSLLLTAGDVNLAAKAIRSFARQVGESRFQTNAALFLQSCKTEQELQAKIDLFSSLFSSNLPPNWQAFFEELSAKTNPLKPVKGWKVFELSPKDKQLLELVARHPDFKDICVKAEGYRILVRDQDWPKLVALLRIQGYLVE